MPTPKTSSRDKTTTPPPATPRPARTRTATNARPRRTVQAAPAAGPSVISEEDIRLRAYFLSLERGAGADPVRDWLEAEQELAALTSAGNGVPASARRRRAD